MKIYSIIADEWKGDGGTCFGVVPKSIWSKLYPCDENNLLQLLTRSLLIIDGDRKILIDPGMGRKRIEKFYQYKYITGNWDVSIEIRKLGFKPEEITDIIFTHLHDDHVGGATFIDKKDNSIKLTFPNATYWSSKIQWDWAINPNKREVASYYKDNLEPLRESGNLKLITETEFQISENISVKTANGHTRGLIIPYIVYEGKTLVYTSDFIPSASHIPLPYIASYDVEPLLVLEEKEAFLEEAVANNYYLVFVHDAMHEGCRVKLTEKGIVAGEFFELGDFS